MKTKKFDSINVIPFIDVLLVLLAIVLMTSTFIAKGAIPVALPTASSSDSLTRYEKTMIVITKENIIFLDKKHISLEALEVKLSHYDRASSILIKSDKESNFDTFVQLLNMLKKNEFENIAIVTKR